MQRRGSQNRGVPGVVVQTVAEMLVSAVEALEIRLSGRIMYFFDDVFMW